MQLASVKSTMAKKELVVTRMVAAMTVTFLLVWSPYAISALLVIAGHSQILDSPSGLVPLIAAKTSTFTNPFIYILLNCLHNGWIIFLRLS